METVQLYNGNKQLMVKDLPAIVILAKEINDIALAHICENTGLSFGKGTWESYEAQPISANQITALLMTYNFKTRYYDNWDYKNTLVMKFCDTAFDVSSICLDCVEHNNMHLSGLTKGDRLAV